MNGPTKSQLLTIKTRDQYSRLNKSRNFEMTCVNESVLWSGEWAWGVSSALALPGAAAEARWSEDWSFLRGFGHSFVDQGGGCLHGFAGGRLFNEGFY